MGGRWASWSRQSAWGEDGGESPPPVVTYSISGTITGDVVEGVTVALSGDDSDSVVTGPSGAYSFSGLADGSYTVTPSLAGYGFTPAATNVTINNADQTGKNFVSTLIPVVFTISGTVYESDGVTPFPNAQDIYVAVYAGTFEDYLWDGEADADENGFYSIDIPLGLEGQEYIGIIYDDEFFAPPSSVALPLYSNGDIAAYVVSNTGENATINLRGLHLIQGEITGDGEIDDTTVDLSGDLSGSTSPDGGIYQFWVDDGDYNVEPSLEGYTFAPESINVSIVAADQTDQDFVSSEITYTLSGTIVDVDASGIEGVTITLTGDASDSTTTDGDGAYSFAGLSDGSYTVTPTLTGYTFIDDHEDVTVSGGNVVAPTMADNGLVVLPFVLDFSDYPSGDLSADDGFFNFDPDNKTMGSIRTSDLADYLNSFTPDGVTGVAEIGAGELAGFRFPHGKVLPSGLTELRIAALCRGSSGTTDDVYLEIGDGDVLSANFAGFLYGFSASLDVFYHRYFINGTQTYNTFTKYGGDLDSRRWHWVRAHWRTSGTQYGEVFRVEDAASLNSHSDSMTFPSVRQHSAILISHNSGVPLVAKFWIGTAFDDWPV